MEGIAAQNPQVPQRKDLSNSQSNIWIDLGDSSTQPRLQECVPDALMHDPDLWQPNDPREDCRHIIKYPGLVQTYGHGKTFMDQFDSDKHADNHKACPYYLFASRDKWEFASFIQTSRLSIGTINKFLKLELVSTY